MITVCAASRRLTLSNALQRIYRAEVSQQRLENSAVACYKRQQLFAPASASSWLSQRPFSTSPANANEESSSTSDVPSHNGRSDDAVLTELTSTKADNTAQRSKSTKDSKSKPAKSKTNEKKTIKEKKTGAKFSLQYVSTQKKPKLEPWQVQKKALKEKFEQGWHPRKKLAPDTLDTIRHLNATKPDDWTTPALAEQFKVSPEAIRRILKSKWQPSEEERQKRQDRWHKRHERLWSHMEQLGLRPEKGEQTAKLSDARRLGLESPRSPSS